MFTQHAALHVTVRVVSYALAVTVFCQVFLKVKASRGDGGKRCTSLRTDD
jgi:hypothetical protein